MNRYLLVPTVIWTAAWLSGCIDDPEVKCGEGTELVAGVCLPLLSDSGSDSEIDIIYITTDAGTTIECGDNSVLVDGSCQGLQPVGAPCERARDCASGTCLTERDGVPDGYCTIVSCGVHRPCPAGSYCYFSGAREQYLCLAFCDGVGECRDDNYVCQPLYSKSVNVCAPRCSEPQDCGGTAVCDESSGKCVLAGCDPQDDGDPCDSENTGRICFEDAKDLSPDDGLCLAKCDPKDVIATCSASEVCQPLAEDPENTGVCATPVCLTTEGCPAGALCIDLVCRPPLRCDDEGKCADESTECVGGPGGQCHPKCPSDETTCADIHPDLVCESNYDVCLPVGSFPGSPCRTGSQAACSDYEVDTPDGSRLEKMVCRDDLCLVDCSDGGTELCENVSSSLRCADTVYDTSVCLPVGSFPGGPCDSEDQCDAVDIDDDSIPMACINGSCALTCDSEDSGDVFCESVNPALVCADDLQGDGVDLCLPRGSFPGGPCAAASRCDSGLVCEDSMCLYDCTSGATPYCEEISESLSCASGIYDTPVCLPKGTFPGGPCGPEDACSQDLSGIDSADMFCYADKCVVECMNFVPFASGDALCSTISSSLTCLDSAPQPFCLPSCDDSCASGTSCLASENACLPTGTFLSSPCADGDICDGEPSLVCVPGDPSICAVGCDSSEPTTGDAYCAAIGTALGTGFNICVDIGGGLEICTTS